ncbi:hypothetical protein FRB93_007567 [Tulasnella sp. JGI-2019a]|nr:hypothetical protein FRB93_007567 [Tulasnella sp. JGI-2019a]
MTTLPLKIAPLTAEEEDKLIIARLANDEKTLRRLTKGFHTITSLSRANPSDSTQKSRDPSSSTSKTREEQLEDAREAFLMDLDQFQVQLIKNMQVCDAETRMVEEYAKDKERIAQEHDTLIRDIAQLKLTLADAHTIRKRRMEYDEIAERINALPSRADSEAAVARHEEEVAVARAERDQRRAEMVARGLEFDLIVNSIREIRTRGLSKEDAGKLTDVADGDMRDADGTPTGNETSEAGPSVLNPNAKPFQPLVGGLTPHGSAISRPSTPRNPGSSQPHLVTSSVNLVVPCFIPTGPRSGRSSPAPLLEASRRKPDDDIEMGEVAEDKLRAQSSPGRKRVPRELEEGEASDGDSVLTDLPDEFQ